MAATDGQVWNRLHEVFGVGDYDPETSTKTWTMWRVGEVGALKRLRESRKVTTQELMDAIEYCRAKGIDVRHSSWLYKHIGDATKWARAERATEAVRDVEALIAQAVAIEAEKPDSVWLDRLIRAAGGARAEVYREWESSSSSRAPSP